MIASRRINDEYNIF